MLSQGGVMFVANNFYNSDAKAMGIVSRFCERLQRITLHVDFICDI